MSIQYPKCPKCKALMLQTYQYIDNILINELIFKCTACCYITNPTMRFNRIMHNGYHLIKLEK